MNTRTMLTLIAFGGTVALVACSSTDEAPFASSDSYCSSRAEAECNGLAKKCGASVDACKKERVTVCTSANSTAVGQGRTYHSDQVQTCLDSINDTYKNSAADVTPDEETKTAAICARVYSGSKKESDTCAQTYECEGALICDKGVCAPENSVKLMGQCNNAGDVCVTGAYCQQQGQTKFCVAKNDLGATCSVDAPCLETSRCVNKCVALETAGQACDVDTDCVIDAPFCDPSTKKCRPKYESTSSACQDYGL